MTRAEYCRQMGILQNAKRLVCQDYMHFCQTKPCQLLSFVRTCIRATILYSCEVILRNGVATIFRPTKCNSWKFKWEEKACVGALEVTS